jgi:hypothetical protein
VQLRIEMIGAGAVAELDAEAFECGSPADFAWANAIREDGGGPASTMTSYVDSFHMELTRFISTSGREASDCLRVVRPEMHWQS